MLNRGQSPVWVPGQHWCTSDRLKAAPTSSCMLRHSWTVEVCWTFCPSTVKLLKRASMFYSSLPSHVAIWFGSLKEYIQERQKDWVWYKTLSKPCNLLYIVSIENRLNSYIFYSVLWKPSDFLELSFIEISPSFESLAVVHNPISVTRVIMCFHTWRAPVDNSVILYEVYYGVREKRKQEINHAKTP